MVNLILEFKKNKKSKGNNPRPIAFHNKKVCLVTEDSDILPKPGEIWECFLWVEKDKYNLVKPFKKIDKKDLSEEQKRVKQFNKELKKLEKLVETEDDFKKIVFDKETNKPYLFSGEPMPELKKNYSDYIIIKKSFEEKWLRPILNSEDRKAFQRQVL
ncbi:hypothetical protein GF327_05855 [Candidatus Woesearchaeota archaeon]|nr:hypothetical protein [Candidatus Woesearchaeota archaeon]